jgi:hypothetical protein
MQHTSCLETFYPPTSVSARQALKEKEKKFIETESLGFESVSEEAPEHISQGYYLGKLMSQGIPPI